MKQILSPFEQYECFEVDGVDYLVQEYTIIQDKEDKLVEWCSQIKIKRLRDHKHFVLPMSKILINYKEGRAKLCKCK